MQNRKRHTDVQNRLLDSVREGEGGMFQENSIEPCILSREKQITSPGGCMRQVLQPGALGRPRGIGRRGRWEGGSGWGIHVTPWLIHVNVWQEPLQYCKVISLQLIKIKIKKKKEPNLSSRGRNVPGVQRLVLWAMRDSLPWTLFPIPLPKVLLYITIVLNQKKIELHVFHMVNLYHQVKLSTCSHSSTCRKGITKPWKKEMFLLLQR